MKKESNNGSFYSRMRGSWHMLRAVQGKKAALLPEIQQKNRITRQSLMRFQWRRTAMWKALILNREPIFL